MFIIAEQIVFFRRIQFYEAIYTVKVNLCLI